MIDAEADLKPISFKVILVKPTRCLPLFAIVCSCIPLVGSSQEKPNESNIPDIRMYFQEFKQIEGVTSPTPTVLGEGPLEVYTHAKPALVVAPKHVNSIQLMYYDGLATIKIKFTKDATDKMVASLKGKKGKRLMTGIVDGKPNGNQSFSGDGFTMQFFFHSLDEAVKIVKAYEKPSDNNRRNQRRRQRGN